MFVKLQLAVFFTLGTFVAQTQQNAVPLANPQEEIARLLRPLLPKIKQDNVLVSAAHDIGHVTNATKEALKDGLTIYKANYELRVPTLLKASPHGGDLLFNCLAVFSTKASGNETLLVTSECKGQEKSIAHNDKTLVNILEKLLPDIKNTSVQLQQLHKIDKVVNASMQVNGVDKVVYNVDFEAKVNGKPFLCKAKIFDNGDSDLNLPVLTDFSCPLLGINLNKQELVPTIATLKQDLTTPAAILAPSNVKVAPTATVVVPRELAANFSLDQLKEIKEKVADKTTTVLPAVVPK